MNFPEQFEVYKQNVFPAMLDHLAMDLGTKTSSLLQLGVGFYPAKQAWVFAERDHQGEIIGLSLRFTDGKKLMEKGSKRGLVYPYNDNYLDGEKRYVAGRCHWVRLQEAGIECPICGKPDWCMVSSDNPEDPSAVLCSRISERSVREISGSGYLHIRRRQCGDPRRSSVLYEPEENHPVCIVEGASDVLAALDLGFTAIGRPSAKGGMEFLKQMPLANKEVWIIGENDAGAGKQGMEKTFHNIKHLSDKVICVMPPEGIKDLRQWVNHGLDQDGLFAYVGGYGSAGVSNPNVFLNDIGMTIAKQFLEAYEHEGSLTLRNHHERWSVWESGRYKFVDNTTFRGKLYAFLDGKSYVKDTQKGQEIALYKPTKSKVNDVIDALSVRCPTPETPPAWIEGTRQGRPDVPSLIAFRNGLLDVDAFCKGEVKMYPSTPDFFTLVTLPYDYDPDSWSDLYEWYYRNTFNNSDDLIELLAQWHGYNLVHDTSQEKFMIFLGPSRSGKSTIISAMEAMLGREQCASTSLRMLANIHGLSSLIGKSAAMAGDVKGTISKHEIDAAIETILRVTGGDTVPVNEKYITPYDTKLTCRFTMAMNELPLFTDQSKAFLYRTLILPFPNCYEGKEDFSLKGKLEKEAASGKLINFALWGLKSLREQGRFTIPSAAKPELETFRELTMPVDAFIRECCTAGSGYEVQKDQVYDAWKGWCIACDRKTGNKQLFDRWFRQNLPSVKVVEQGTGDYKHFAYVGVAMNKWVFQKYLGRPA